MRAVLAEYGVVIAEPAEVALPTPAEFAEANMADLLAEDPDFAELSEERRMELIEYVGGATSAHTTDRGKRFRNRPACAYVTERLAIASLTD